MKNPGTRTRLEAFLAEPTKWRRTPAGCMFFAGLREHEIFTLVFVGAEIITQ